jgi:hypothetical protein
VAIDIRISPRQVAATACWWDGSTLRASPVHLPHAIDATAPSLPRRDGPESRPKKKPPATSSDGDDARHHQKETLGTHEQEVRRLQVAVHYPFFMYGLYRFKHLLPS